MPKPAKYPRIEFCPRLAAAFKVLGKRWNALILDILSQRPARFSEIDHAVPGLSDRVLSERLRELVETGLIRRRVDPERRTRVYELTERGRRLMPALDELRAWATPLVEAEEREQQKKEQKGRAA